jgi:hypothetical protein
LPSRPGGSLALDARLVVVIARFRALELPASDVEDVAGDAAADGGLAMLGGAAPLPELAARPSVPPVVGAPEGGSIHGVAAAVFSRC